MPPSCHGFPQQCKRQTLHYFPQRPEGPGLVHPPVSSPHTLNPTPSGQATPVFQLIASQVDQAPPCFTIFALLSG